MPYRKFNLKYPFFIIGLVFILFSLFFPLQTVSELEVLYILPSGTLNSPMVISAGGSIRPTIKVNKYLDSLVCNVTQIIGGDRRWMFNDWNVSGSPPSIYYVSNDVWIAPDITPARYQFTFSLIAGNESLTKKAYVDVGYIYGEWRINGKDLQEYNFKDNYLFLDSMILVIEFNATQNKELINNIIVEILYRNFTTLTTLKLEVVEEGDTWALYHSSYTFTFQDDFKLMGYINDRLYLEVYVTTNPQHYLILPPIPKMLIFRIGLFIMGVVLFIFTSPLKLKRRGKRR